ncbi:T6SS immunity protein Tli3 family protein [Burkholderia sp. LMG 21824]|uniref:T6SS immunity protein Tli3 family protein n=1 Tax=Burkholderia sp. LMG 21824 TaxID=3158172 RepID=UPI003C2C6133
MKSFSVVIALVVLTSGCATQPPQRPTFKLSDFRSSTLKELPYDSPPQTIYRIDDHRFVTLERYRDCNHGESYYNDTRMGIRKYLGRGRFENFQGRIINADPTGMNIVLPLAYPPRAFCGNGEKGCVVPFWYSTDGGRTFLVGDYADHSFRPFDDSKNYTFAVTKEKLYIAEKSAGNDVYVLEYPMINGIDLSRPYPAGVKGDSFAESKRPQFLRGIFTPSGQDRITCDSSLKPTNPDAPLVQ